MSKAVLIIDMPHDCEECPLYDEDQMRCYYLRNDKYAVDVIPSWCPLKPIPKKMKPVVLHQCIEDEYLYQKGFNDCLEEIEK